MELVIMTGLEDRRYRSCKRLATTLGHSSFTPAQDVAAFVPPSGTFYRMDLAPFPGAAQFSAGGGQHD
jgi:hypothetical protein